MNNANKIVGSPKLEPYEIQCDIPEIWEHLYVYGTSVLGEDCVKLCPSSQSPGKFIERTARFYPDPVKILLQGIHPVCNRLELEKLTNECSLGNGFYKIPIIELVSKYLHKTESDLQINSFREEVIARVNTLCHPSSLKTVKVGDIIDRLSMFTKTGKAVSSLIMASIISPNGDDCIPYYWKHDSLTVYRSFIDYYVNKVTIKNAKNDKNNENSEEEIQTIRFADVLVAARKWFVYEERLNGLKIPHKSARCNTLSRLLIERFGEATCKTGKGQKDNIWKLNILVLKV